MAGIVAVAALSGCGGGAGDEAELASSPPTSAAAPAEEPTVEEPAYPATPEGEIDKLADEKGWMPDEVASAYVADMCVALPERKGVGSDPAEWLMMQKPDADQAAVLRAGVPKLCPDWSKTVTAALGGKASRSYSGGTYVVTADPGTDEEAIAPGTYRATGDLADCYWERTTKAGGIIDNGFATSAREITVTIRVSDGQFTSRDCGTWKPVK
ncbi:hypothetical protein ACFRCX_30400 [Streptomyces sp. NPDC056652]|uniref:hypothetical protein n=1 Tax=Streptomyces sp. NPDC056652 TaxID=3345893 RepID=UPI003678BF48